MLNLSKGERLDLSKVAPGMTKSRLALGWDANKSTSGKAFDLDAMIVMRRPGEVPPKEDTDLVYYGGPNKNPTTKEIFSKCGSIVHHGDNLTGEGAGDDEIIDIDLNKIPAEYDRLICLVSIYDNISRNQNFGQVDNAYIRLDDMTSGTANSIGKFDLTEDYSAHGVVIMGEMYKKDGVWKFQAKGEGHKDLETYLRTLGFQFK